MSKSLSLLGCALLSSLLNACGASSPSASSQTQGHYEEATSTAMNKYQGQQRVPAEYAPSQGVIISHTLLRDYGREDLVKAIVDADVEKVWVVVPRGSRETLQSSSFSELRRTLGRQLEKIELMPQKGSGGLTVWARDWSPLGAVTQEGDLRLLDLNYYPYRPADDSTGQAFAGLKGVGRVSVPVYNEGGNFMANERGDCLMTTRVTDANSAIYMAGDMVLDAGAIRGYYQNYAGCKRVHIFPRMPTERTGHIDMWAKFLDDDTVIVSEISAASLAKAKDSELNFARTIQSFLEQRADDVAALGFNVVRIPMPLPRQGWFRSYTNSLLVNGTAIIPQYGEAPSSDGGLVEDYEDEVKKIYAALGFKTVFIPSDDLIFAGGAVHCVTMQIADPR